MFLTCSPLSRTLQLVTLAASCVVALAIDDGNIWRHVKLDPATTTSVECPVSCTCSAASPLSDDIEVDCAGVQLVRVPHNLPPNTARLLLANNRIAVLRADDLVSCSSSLRVLDLSRNNLELLADGCLATAVHLRELYLDQNLLNVSKISPGAFASLTELNVLRLHDNNQADMMSAGAYNDQLFEPLAQLNQLTVDGIPNAKFGGGFAGLRQLESLGVYGQLDAVDNDTFEAFGDAPIRELKIRNGRYLNSLSPMSFGYFRQLETLDLGYNSGLGLGENMTRSWYGLQFTNISKLILTRTSHSKADELTRAFYEPLTKTRIRYFQVDKNDIVHFEPLLAKCLPLLEYFDMSYNRIANVGSMIIDLWQLKHLLYLDMSHQDKRFHSKGGGDSRLDAADSPARRSGYGKRPRAPLALAGDDSRKDDIWFSQCSTPPLKPCPLPPIFDGSHKVFPVTVDQTWCIPPAPKLAILNLTQSSNVEMFDMPAIIIFGARNLKHLVYQQSGYRRVVGPIVFTQQPNGSMIDLSANYISCLSPDAFNISYRLGVTFDGLDFSRNNLAYQLEIDERGRTFQFGRNTTILNLSQNDIASLPPAIFRNMSSLITLNLSRNFLRMIDFEFSHMKQLRQLDLSHNLLTNLDADIQRKFSAAFAARQSAGEEFALNLYGNPLECSCASLQMLHWMDVNEPSLVDFRNYSCIYRRTVVSFVNLTGNILTELDFVCSKPLAVVISASMLALVLVLTTLSLACYRYRWEIRYCCLRLTQRGKRYQLLVDQPTRRFDYDAFVVYDSADRDWVNGQLLPHLEPDEDEKAVPAGSHRQQRLRLCVHERDFLPGEDIVGNIWNKMERSRKTILVISRTFLASNYCNYETQLARMSSVELGRNVIVPVLLDQVDSLRDMTECLRWVLRKLTYIEWPEQPSDRADFWRRLRESVTDLEDLSSGLQMYAN